MSFEVDSVVLARGVWWCGLLYALAGCSEGGGGAGSGSGDVVPAAPDGVVAPAADATSDEQGDLSVVPGPETESPDGGAGAEDGATACPDSSCDAVGSWSCEGLVATACVQDPVTGCPTPGAVVSCADESACSVDLCDPALGCIQSPLGCGDGDGCNGVETCDPATGCQAGDPLLCDDGLVCNGSESCHATLGCISGAAPPGCCSEDADCEEGNACNGIGWCELATGTCKTSPPPICDDGDPCNGVEGCLPAEGCVLGVPMACDDLNACNGIESCDAASGCQPGFAPTCDDGLPCNGLESCHPTSGCLAGAPQPGCCTFKKDCEDGNPCNGLSHCDSTSGTCTVLAPAGCDDGNPCNGFEGCDADIGCTVLAPPPSCADDNPCNGLETCTPSGGCAQGTPQVCGDDSPCNGIESCDPLLGCVTGEPPKCSDGNACNGTELCDPEHGCVGGSALDCEDGNLCNGLESCGPEVGCVAGEPLLCGDGNPCNGQEVCGPQQGCLPGEPPACDDHNSCNGLESCDPLVGCVSAPAPPCGDGNACNGSETCVPAAGCTPGTPPSCDDDNACNGDEACDPALGCVGEAPLACDDGDACTGVETCEPATGCVAGEPLACDDGNPCTDDLCAPAVGCQHSFNVAPCNDGVACTFADACQDGACSGYGYTCEDGLACTGDLCDGAGDCTSEPLPGWCVIAEECVEGGATSPEQPCTTCDPSQPMGWSPATGAACGPLPGAAIATCVEGSCVPECDDGRLDCEPLAPGCEVDGSSDPSHCGSCEITCAADQVCSEGSCASDCEGGLIVCGQACVDLASDTDHCGECGASCALFAVLESGCVEGECTVITCVEGFYDADSVAAGGCECVQQSGGVELCNGLDDDCDGQTDEDPPFELVAEDLDHCGACDTPCSSGPPSHRAVCKTGLCALLPCAPGSWDLNADAHDGCEYACTVANGGVEGCNGDDDDCDGEVDEGFDLTADIDHCGACGHSCQHPTATAWSCAAGACAVVQCIDGFADEDADPDNGCEVEAQQIWVDAIFGDDGLDGDSADLPVRTLTRALELAEAGAWIHLALGNYTGVVIEVPGITIAGAGPYVSNITAAGAQDFALRIDEAPGVTIRDLAVLGTTSGISILSSSGVRLEGLTLSDLNRLAVEAKWSAGFVMEDVEIDGVSETRQDYPAVWLHLCSEATLEGVRIHAVSGEEYDGTTGGFEGVALRMTSSVKAKLYGVEIADVVGGSTGYSSIRPGAARGILAIDCAGCVFEDLRIHDLRGLDTGGSAGHAIALQLEGFDGGTLDRVAITKVSGGVPTQFLDKSPGVALGLVVADSQLPLTIRRLSAGALTAQEDARALQVEANQLGAITLQDSILAEVEGPCIHDSATGVVQLDYTWLIGCTDGEQSPSPFVDAAAGDVHLEVDSGLIDQGDPASDYCLEPQPNGGRVNPGYWGNTAEATAHPSAADGACGAP